MTRRMFRIVAALAVLAAGCKKKNAAPAIAGVSNVIPPDPAVRLDGEQAIVTSSQGKVELLRGASGAWSDAKVGDRLSAKDSIRTGLGQADVAVEGVKIRVNEFSRLDMSTIDKRTLHTRLHGSLESDVEQTGKLDVDMGDTDATAHSEGGHFFVTADGRGVMAVATVTGSVRLSNGGKTVEVGKGQVSKIGAAKDAPAVPAAALRRVLLSVQWPNVMATNKPSMPIAGRVEPGSRVFIQGEQISVDTGGIFRARVPLKHGKQKIAVVTVDALGRRKHVESTVLRDDSLPDVKVKKKLWQWH
ncbi:MAG: hypothetical protein ABR567_19530 [Myxococcales bacterium]|nr:hypothetical protein [Myxococcales bacterium]